jgi:hypothetical protein
MTEVDIVVFIAIVFVAIAGKPKEEERGRKYCIASKTRVVSQLSRVHRS